MELVEVIKCYLNNNKCDIELSDKLINDSIEHGLSGILYDVYNDNKVKKYYLASTINQEKYIRESDNLTLLFNNNKIKHLYIKGTILYKIYDDPVIRSRGDIDVYVGMDDFERAENILINNGYEIEEKECMHHVGFKHNGLEIELHFSLFDGYEATKASLLFKDPFIYSTIENKYLYKMDDTMHLIYCICHFLKHLKFGGGLRYILDFYYILSKQNINYDILHKYINELNYNIIYNNILNAIYYFTNKKYDSFEIYDIEFFIKYMYDSGIHGFKRHKDDEESMFLGKSKFTYLMSKVFLTNEKFRIVKYPKYGNKWYCYPFLVIHNIFHLIKTKFKRFFKFIKNKPTKEQKLLYKKIGIIE